MKGFFEVLAVTFVTVGSVIGAGFISGRELVGFFGSENFFFPLIFTTVGFFLCLSVLYTLGNRYVTLSSLNKSLLNGSKYFDYAVYFSSFVSVCGLLAVLDEVGNGITFFNGFPILSFAAIIVLSTVSRYGIRGVEKISIVLVPVIIVAVNVLVFVNGNFSFTGAEVFSTGGVKTVLYVAMNCFINLPAIVDVAGKKNKKFLYFSAAVVSTILFVQAFLILSVVKTAGTFQSAMPLYDALKSGKYIGVYTLCVLAAVTSSLVSAYYPLYSSARRKGGALGVALLGISAFVCSRLGLKNIVDYVYPVVGAAGTLYLIKCIIFLIRTEKNGYGRRKRRFGKRRNALRGKTEKNV